MLLYARYLIEIHLGIPVCLAAPSVITKYGTKVKYPHLTQWESVKAVPPPM
ncbi:MAG: hypothetical protein R2688_07240 [Fimbriimonadaceae bacterium]